MLLVVLLVSVAFARPDVSHLKTVEFTTPITSYDVPLKSIDNKYVASKYYRYEQENVPNVSLLPPFVHNQQYQTSVTSFPSTNVAVGQQHGLASQLGTSSGQSHYVSGSSSGGQSHQLTGTSGQFGTSGGQSHYVSGSLSGGQSHQGSGTSGQFGTSGGQTHYVSSTSSGGHGSSGNQNQGVHVLTQHTQGTGQQGTHFVVQQGQQGVHSAGQQSQGAGQHAAHFVVQQGQGLGQQQGAHHVIHQGAVNQPHQTEFVKTQFVSQTTGHQPFVGNRFTSDAQNVGHVNVVHDAGFGQQQQYVKNEEHVYYFSAPEEIKQRTRLRINVVPTHTKKTNVIFVNAPNAPEVIPEVVVPPHQIVEDKTKVVVLVKEHDQFIPITVPGPLPVTKGKAEVFVVKYHNKGDAERILSGSGNVYGSTLIQQDKPSFSTSLNANLQHSSGSNTFGVLPRFEGAGLSTLQQTNSGNSQSVSIQESAGQVSSNLQVDGGLSGIKSVQIIGTTPKSTENLNFGKNTAGGSYSTSTYSYETQGGNNEGFVDSKLLGGVGTLKSNDYGTINVVTVKPTVSSLEVQNIGQSGSNEGQYEIKTVSTSAQEQSNIGDLNLSSFASNAGGKQVNTYEVKNVPVPAVTYIFENKGGNLEDKILKSKGESKKFEYSTVDNVNRGDLGVRFGSDVDGSSQNDYSIQTTKFVQNVPTSESVGFDNIDQIRKLLGDSGIEIVSISKGSLAGSAAGPQSQEAFFKSLGIDSGSFSYGSGGVSQDGNVLVKTVEIKEKPKSIADLPLQSGFEGHQQIQIGNDVADVIGRSSLRS